jgi:hypothetical protein
VNALMNLQVAQNVGMSGLDEELIASQEGLCCIGVSAWKVASCACRQLSTIDSWFRQWVFSFPQWRNSPQCVRAFSLSRLHDHTLTRHSR